MSEESLASEEGISALYERRTDRRLCISSWITKNNLNDHLFYTVRKIWIKISLRYHALNVYSDTKSARSRLFTALGFRANQVIF